MAGYSFLDKSPFEQMSKFKEALDAASADLTSMNPAVKRSQQWNPYAVSGGTATAVAFDDFVVVASDTRMSSEHEVNILTRNCEKTHVLSNRIILNTCGFYGDVLQLKRLLQARLDHYAFVYQHEMSVNLCAEMLSRTLYYRRFFPYYTGSILCGIDDDGKGAIYGYDPVGTLERHTCTATGSGGTIMLTYLDNLWDKATWEPEKRDAQPKPSVEDACRLICDGYRALAERETSTGDSIKLCWIKAGDSKVSEKIVKLRED